MKKKRPLLQCISSLVLFLLLFVGLQTNPSQLLTMQSMTHPQNTFLFHYHCRKVKLSDDTEKSSSTSIQSISIPQKAI